MCQFLLYKKVTESYIYIYIHTHIYILCTHRYTCIHTHTHIYIYIYIYTYFFSHCGLSQDIGYSFLCYILGPDFLSITIVIVLHLLTPNSPFLTLPPPSPLATTNLFSVSLFLFCRQVHLCYNLDSTYKWYHMESVFLFLTYFT